MHVQEKTRAVGSFTESNHRSFDDATDGERGRGLLSADFAAHRENNTLALRAVKKQRKQSLATYLSTLSLSDGSVEEAESLFYDLGSVECDIGLQHG